MLIGLDEITQVIKENGIQINGAFHIGAHDCEELSFYSGLGIVQENVVWIDGMLSKVQEAQARGIPNVFNAVITDQDDAAVSFNVSNNIQSSSVLEFGTHSQEHPWVVYIGKIPMRSITVDTFFARNEIDPAKYDFWNFDIQGAELMALKGATNAIQYVKAIYLEVNVRELYKNCGLITDIDEYLAQHNFKRVLTNITQWGWGDALYIRNK